MNKIALLITVLLLTACAPIEAYHSDAESVVLPEKLACKACVPLQQKYLSELKVLATEIPFNEKINSMGFIDWKGKNYLSIYLLGDTYNTIKTSSAIRLSSEFVAKFHQTAKIALTHSFVKEVAGLHITLQCYATNFVTDEFHLDKTAEILEVFANTVDIQQFISGDITSQDLLDKSLVFIDGQRTKLNLQSL
jgi:hypothetical protein